MTEHEQELIFPDGAGGPEAPPESAELHVEDAGDTGPEPASFEEALTRLEEIVAAMESGRLTLDECMKQFAEGTRLSNYCMRRLASTEKRIEILLKQAPTPEWAEFREPTGEAEALS